MAELSAFITRDHIIRMYGVKVKLHTFFPLASMSLYFIGKSSRFPLHRRLGGPDRRVKFLRLPRIEPRKPDTWTF
jgi:hypothetical protein